MKRNRCCEKKEERLRKRKEVIVCFNELCSERKTKKEEEEEGGGRGGVKRKQRIFLGWCCLSFGHKSERLLQIGRQVRMQREWVGEESKWWEESLQNKKER